MEHNFDFEKYIEFLTLKFFISFKILFRRVEKIMILSIFKT
jgi:hypothetical protein